MLTRPARRRLLPVSVVAALFAALFLGLPSPAEASSPPALKAISVISSTVTVPATVQFAYTVEDPASLQDIVVRLKDVDGRRFWASENVWQHTPLTGRIALPLRDGVRNGAYTVESVSLWGVDGTSYVEYRRDSTPSLAGADFTVSGSAEDREAPALSGLTVSPATVRPGDIVTVSWAGIEEAHTHREISFVVRNSVFGHEWSSGNGGNIPLDSKSYSFQVSENAYNGDYTLTRFTTSDDFENTATYRGDGSVSRTPNGLGPATHDLDLSSVKFTVTGSTRDIETPALTGLSVPDTTLTAGQSAIVDYTVADDQPAMDHIQMEYTAPDGAAFLVQDAYFPQLSARISEPVRKVGRYLLTKVTIADRGNHKVEYRRDGTALVNGATHSKHSFDFSKLDLAVRPSAPTVRLARPKPRAVVLTWDQDPLQLPGIASYRVEVTPGGRAISVPVNRQGTNPRQSYTVTGLTNAAPYSFSITAQSGVGAGPSRVASATPRMSDRIFGLGNVNQDGARMDVFAYGPTSTNTGTVSVYLGNGRGGFTGTRTTMERGLTALRLAPGGDIATSGNDGYALVTSTGSLEIHTSDGRGAVSGRYPVGSGWASMKFVDGGYDFTGDGRSDVLGVAKNGDLYLYRVNGNYWLDPGRRIGTGWGSMLAVMSAGDVNGDRFNDVVAVDSSGTMRLYKGNGKGGWLGTSTRIGSGWSIFGAVFPMRDFSGDGRVDLGAVTMSGDFYLYKGNGKGGFPTRTKIGHGWHNFF